MRRRTGPAGAAGSPGSWRRWWEVTRGKAGVRGQRAAGRCCGLWVGAAGSPRYAGEPALPTTSTSWEPRLDHGMLSGDTRRVRLAVVTPAYRGEPPLPTTHPQTNLCDVVSAVGEHRDTG